MNHFKSLKIGNNPLLVMGCTVIAFGVTQFYYTDADPSKLMHIIGSILLFPARVFNFIAGQIGLEDLRNNAIIIFLVLLLSYSFVALAANKILEWRSAENQ